MTAQELLEKYKQKTITKEELDQLQQDLKRAYYETGSPLISDDQYDEMFNTSTEPVGYKNLNEEHFAIEKHGLKMSSLVKIKTYEQAIKWINGRKVIIQPKLDGLSINLNYKNGNLVSALLRGDGEKGQNIIQNARHFKGVPLTISYKEDISIRGEIVISLSDFNNIKDNYSNRRNAVSGISSRHDSLHSNLLAVYSYDLVSKELFYNESDKVLTLYNLGFKVPFVVSQLTEERYLTLADSRMSAEEYQMDGLVIKLDSIKEQEELGYKNDRPQGQMALKFPPEGVKTKILNYEWNNGITGAAIPKAIVEPVDLQGTTIRNVGMSSLKLVKELNASIGSEVIVRRMGDVTPKITEVITYGNNDFNMPTTCKHCSSILEIDGANIFCKNNACIDKTRHRVAAIIHILNLKNIGSGMFTELVDKQIIKSYPEFFTVTAETLSNNAKVSLDRAIKITEKISIAKSNLTFSQLLSIINVPGLSGAGFTKLKEATEDNFIDLLDYSEEQFIAILGKSKGSATYNTFKEQEQEIQQLLALL